MNKSDYGLNYVFSKTYSECIANWLGTDFRTADYLKPYEVPRILVVFRNGVLFRTNLPDD